MIVFSAVKYANDLPVNELTMNLKRSSEAEKAIIALRDPHKARILARFFKTGKGEYGEGDVFLGLTVPQQRSVAHRFMGLTLPEINQLLTSIYHECRLTALIILERQFRNAITETERRKIVTLYLTSTSRINSWDLVDLSAPNILGAYLTDKPITILTKLSKSACLWERRIAIVSTFWFIRHNRFAETLRITEILLHDPHDLIHKAVGWMLREIGKRDKNLLIKFLDINYHRMPRTMLRYAIEKFEPVTRRHYMIKPVYTNRR